MRRAMVIAHDGIDHESMAAPSARIDNVPGADLLAVLAKVIADEEPAETLNQFPEWVAAG